MASRSSRRGRLDARQQDDATCRPSGATYPPCDWVGNEVRACYPTADDVIQQNTWTKLIWNAKHPLLAQLGFIDVYLRSAENFQVVTNWTHVPTAQGEVTSCADDDWLRAAGPELYQGKDITWNFQYIIVQTGTPYSGAEPAEASFTVLQNRPLNAVVAASSSSAQESASISASQASASASNGASTNSNSPGSNPNLQGDGGGDDFPAWAIALLVVLGVLVLLFGLAVSFFSCRWYRRRERRRQDPFRRESMGSEAPMMTAVGGSGTEPTSPTQGARPGAGFPRSYRGAADASSTTSHTDSALFTNADAAFVADAFRNAMRKPDFKDRPLEEGESPDAVPDLPKTTQDIVLSRELAEEGRDIRSVRSERGVRVESLPDHDRD